MARVTPPVKLFDVGSRDNVHAKNHRITIDTGENKIIGALTSEFSFNVNAQWEPIFSTGGVIQTIEDQLTKFGFTAFKSGIFTRKFYKGGSYLEFQSDFRIVDWEGDYENSVVRAAKILADSTLPIVPQDIKENVNTIYGAGKEFVDDSFRSGANNLSNSSVANQVSTVAKNGKAFIDTVTNIGAKEVSVTLGNYWRGKLIIEDVNAKYSLEQTESGPLYGDFTVKFSTREIPSRGNLTGFQSASGRVSVS